MKDRSLIPQIAELWATLSQAEKDVWDVCADYENRTAYRGFVMETTRRIKGGFSIPNVPTIYHLSWIGYCQIDSPASSIKLVQYHPAGYWIYKKVKGTKSTYEPVYIQESMGLPLQIGISYRADLTPVGDVQVARFYAVVMSSYQGVDRENIVEINFENDSIWHIATSTISEIIGHIIGYTLYIEISGYTGMLYFDHIKSVHTSVNWARDPNCFNINITFTNQYRQIPKYWYALELSEGSKYDSGYFDGI